MKHRGKSSSTFVPLYTCRLRPWHLTVKQLTLSFTGVDDVTVDYDSLSILSFVGKDGETKVIETKDFSDPEKRGAFYAQGLMALAKGGFAA